MSNEELDNAQQGKGRPTPKRAEAEAHRRTNAKLPRDPKAARKAMRLRQREATMRQRTALYTGDEKALPARDQGPIRKRVRTYVDSRISSGEVFLPVAFLVMFAAFVQSQAVIVFVNTVWSLMLIVVIADSVWMTFRLRKLIGREFPETLRPWGHVGYGVMRGLTMRLMRLPKPRVSIGGKPRTPKVPKAYQR